MKNKTLAVIGSGTAVVALCLAGVCFPQAFNAQTEPAPVSAPDQSAAPDMPDNAPAMPTNIYPTSPLAQVINLTQSGVGESVIMAYVTNSGSTFNLDPDKIIYLKDIGAPDDLVTAMMQRDQALQAQMSASAYQPPPQPAPAVEPAATVPVATEVPVEQPAPVTVNYFYSSLAPYGSWVNVEGYGRCWRPTVVVANGGWQPYCDHGHWVYTDCGWYWYSDYSWGWAPFHYGRWFQNARFGWCWAPGTAWGPSWVTWRYSGNYCGWAPLPPFAAYSSGIGFTYRGASVSVDFNFGLGASCYTFVPTGNFCDPHPGRYRVAPTQVTQIYNNTTVINNFNQDSHNRTFINHGIDPGRITQVTHRQINQVTIRDTNERVPRGEQLGRDGRTLMVNRPHFADNPRPSDRNAAPHSGSPSPVVGSPYQPPHNGNNNSQPQRNGQLAPVGTGIGSPYQPPHTGNQNNNNSQTSRNGQPAQTMPPTGQRQYPPVNTPGSPGHNQTTLPTDNSPSTGNRHVPVTSASPQTPNYNSTDNRRYPSPHMQQIEQQSPGVYPRSSAGHVGAPVTPQPPAQPSQHNYGAPVTTPPPTVRQPVASYSAPPPVQQTTPLQPQQNYASPRSQTPSSESHPNYSQQPAAGYQSHSASAPSSAPAQSQKSGGNRNQNGQ